MIIDNFYNIMRTDMFMKQLVSWFKQWDIEPACLETLPKTGFIVDNIAALFVYETNSKLAFIDYLISNKEQDKSKTNEALDMLIDHSFAYCKSNGYKYVISNSKYDAVVSRVKKHGCNVDSASYRVFGRSI